MKAIRGLGATIFLAACIASGQGILQRQRGEVVPERATEVVSQDGARLMVPAGTVKGNSLITIGPPANPPAALTINNMESLPDSEAITLDPSQLVKDRDLILTIPLTKQPDVLVLVQIGGQTFPVESSISRESVYVRIPTSDILSFAGIPPDLQEVIHGPRVGEDRPIGLQILVRFLIPKVIPDIQPLLYEYDNGSLKRVNSIVHLPPKARIAVLIHGILSNKDRMRALADDVKAEGKRYAAILIFEYPYWRHIEFNGDMLARELQHYYPGVRIDLYGHSMGGLVAKAAIFSKRVGGFASRVKGLMTFGTPHKGVPWPDFGWLLESLGIPAQYLDGIRDLLSCHEYVWKIDKPLPRWIDFASVTGYSWQTFLPSGPNIGPFFQAHFNEYKKVPFDGIVPSWSSDMGTMMAMEEHKLDHVSLNDDGDKQSHDRAVADLRRWFTGRRNKL